jgi:signal transduction histidine kinase
MIEKPKILIVDDKLENLIALETILQDIDVEFIRALSGNEALALTIHHRFAMAIIDIQMPGMDGYETVELLRSDPDSDLFPIIFVSAIFKEEFHVVKGIESGAVDFISKPIIPQILRGKVNVFLDMHRQKVTLESINEELIMAREVALAASRTKSMFLANMSHEIRTPMNGIIGVAEMLRNSELNEEQKELLRIIEVSGNNLLIIINDILDFSKIETGNISLEETNLDLKLEIEQTLSLMKFKAQQKEIKLNLIFDKKAPRYYIGDPVRIKQIFINLVGNALKFTDIGSVDVRVKLMSSSNDKVKLYCAVQDTGIGISEEAKQKLFHAFTQADVSFTRRFGGTGLGLAISHQLCKLMNGEIGVESEEGQGSTFWFTIELPIGEKPAPEEETCNEVDLNSLKRFNVLLAEDNLINQKVERYALEKFGHFVEIAKDGKVAVEKFEAYKYDLILMDIQMPEMDGLEATRRIREIEKEAQVEHPVRIVALTACVMEGDRERFLAVGMNDVISKPFKMEDMRRLFNEKHTHSESQIV